MNHSTHPFIDALTGNHYRWLGKFGLPTTGSPNVNTTVVPAQLSQRDRRAWNGRTT